MNKLLSPENTQDLNLSSYNDDEVDDSLCEFSGNDVFSELSIRRKVEDILEQRELRNDLDDFFDC